jgi:ferric-dicitrate binding protein FerR (iron transport regulator)
MDSRNIRVTPQWKKSKSRVWEECFAGLEEHSAAQKPAGRVALFSGVVARYSAVAALVIGLMIPVAATLSVKRINTAEGAIATIYLPDSSKVVLNAATEISYNSLLWLVNRRVKMEGEAFFEVSQGKKFIVESTNGSVSVIGTSFNVFDRDSNYRVSCVGGVVAVKSRGDTVILSEGMEAETDEKGILVSRTVGREESVGWVDGILSFRAEPLVDVIDEIERQYGVKIVFDTDNIDYIYTGRFSRERPLGEVLEILGKPFGIEFNIEK